MTDFFQHCRHRIAIRACQGFGQNVHLIKPWLEDAGHAGFVLTLDMQVTRAETNEQFWRTLGRQGAVTETSMPSASVDQIAEALYNSARRKANLASRSKVVLVLDAQRTPVPAFASVAERCRLNHGDALWALDFQAIWLVGLTPEMTERLDAPETV